MIYILLSGLAFLLIEKKFGILDILNPFVVYIIYYVFFLLIALSWTDNFEVSKGVEIEERTKQVIVAGLILSILTAFIFQSLFKIEKNGKVNLSRKVDFRDIIIAPSSVHSIISAYFILFLGIILWLIFIIKAGDIPILAVDAENFRIEARKGMGSFTILSTSLLTYGGLFILSAQNHNFVLKYSLLFVIFFLILSFGNRAPALFFLLFFFTLKMIKKEEKVDLIKPVIIGLSLYILLVIIGAYRMNTDVDLQTMFFLQIGWRPFVNIQNLNLILNDFDNFLYGYGYWIDFYVIAPGYSPNLGTWLKEYFNLTFDGGSITTTILGEGYVNFGYPGLFIYPIMTSFILLRVNLIQKKKLLENNLQIPLGKLITYLIITVGLGGIVSSGYTSVVLYMVLPAIIVYNLHKISIKKRNI